MFGKGEGGWRFLRQPASIRCDALVAAYRLSLRGSTNGWTTSRGGFLSRRGGAVHRGRVVTFLDRRAGGERKDGKTADG